VDTTPTLPGPPAPARPRLRAHDHGQVSENPDGDLALGRYRLVRRLGAGGVGAVWLARDERLGREVAVKAMPRSPTEGAEGRRRTSRAHREALAAARLNHPGVVTLYEAGADAESHYLISELVAGRTLDQLLVDGALSDRDIARIGLALAGALEHAHERGVVHRDVKPQNVIVPDRPEGLDGVAKLTDFGVARLVGDDPLTRTGDVVGTLAYMAPEQAEGRRAGPSVDLYALGLVLYEALSGSHPVRGRGPAATARRLGAVLPSLGRARRGLPPELVAAVDRAVRPHPTDRGSLADLRRALESALPKLSDEGGTLAVSLRPPRLVRGAGRLAAAVAAGALAATATTLAPVAPVGAAVAAAAVAAVVFVLPRLGWLAAALATVGWLAAPPSARPGTALVLAAALAPCPLLLPRAGRAWSLPAAAPLLGLIGLAAAFPALAGQLATLRRRAATGALGAWWLALAQPLLGRDLMLGQLPGSDPLSRWEGSITGAAAHAVWPAVLPGALLALAWGLSAGVLPWLVRGRSLAADLLGAGLWAVVTASATIALTGLAGTSAARAVAGAAEAGAAAAALLAIALCWLRRPPAGRPLAWLGARDRGQHLQ
jgi:eukaryotic-like serine/threonine-protein kinase